MSEAAKSTIKKISLGGIQKKKEASSKTAYPILADPNGEFYRLAKLIKQQTEELEAIEGALEANKRELKDKAMPEFFKINQGKTEIPSSVAIPTTEGEVLVTFANRYKKIEDEGPVMQLMGEDFVSRWFKQAFSITIEGDKLATIDPSNPDRNPAQEFIDELTQLINKHQAGDAVSQKSEIKPVKEFHEKRHGLLPAEQNVALDKACPMIVMVKTKGRD